MHTADTAPAPGVSPLEDVDVRYYWGVLRRHGVVIVGLVFVAAAVVGLATWMRPQRYEASVHLLVAAPKLQEGNVPAVAPSTYRAMLSGDQMVRRVLQEFRLEQIYGLTPERFVGEALSITEERNTPLLRLAVALPDPELAAKVTNRLAEMGIEASRRLSQSEAVEAREAIKLQVEEARNQYTAKAQELTTFRREHQIEALQSDVTAQLDQRKNLLKLQVQIEGERAKAVQAEEERGKRQRLEILQRDVLAWSQQWQELNPVYARLDQEAATSRSQLASLEGQRRQIEQRRLGQPVLDSLNHLYTARQRIEQLELELDIARSVYKDISLRYEGARAQVAGRSPQLQLLSPAMAPTRPLPRGTVKNAALAGIVTLLLVCVAVLLRNAVSPSAPRVSAQAAA